MSTLVDRLRTQREDQIQFVTQTLERANADGGRDLVDTELANVVAARQRVAEIDAQLGPVVEFETARAAGAELLARMPGQRDNSDVAVRGAGGAVQAFAYKSPGAYVLDRLKAKGVDAWGWKADPQAAERIAAVAREQLANQTTGNTPGILPTPIVGDIVNTVDFARPFMTSIGIKALGGIPGATFSRPKISTHTQSGIQTTQKTALNSRAMQIDPITFSKKTYGGYVNISQQDIDWTSPAAWDALIRDLANTYGRDVEDAICAAFVAGLAAANTVTLGSATPTLKDWMTGLYQAAALSYAGCGMLPDRLWCSVDMWAELGALTDVTRIAMPPTNADVLGDAGLTRFSGNVLDAPRVVCPGLPDGTVVVGASQFYEIYEEQLGVLSVVEPSIAGVEVAYAGYIAAEFLENKAFANIVKPVAP